jgi:hypothetical protein
MCVDEVAKLKTPDEVREAVVEPPFPDGMTKP